MRGRARSSRWWRACATAASPRCGSGTSSICLCGWGTDSRAWTRGGSSPLARPGRAGRRLFPSLPVEENLRVAAARRGKWPVQSVLEVFPLLQPRRHMAAANLSGGEQQAVAIGRALMSNPRLLLLDEVSLGLAPIVVDAVYRSLAGILGEDTTLVVVEQDLTRARKVASRVIWMLEGRIVLESAASSLDRDRVVSAYFGLKRPA